MIKLSNITKKYVDKKTVTNVLNGITIEFPNTGFVSVTGPSGCGKTTLMNIIGGLDLPSSGEISIIKNTDDKQEIINYNEMDLDSYRNSDVGFVFQSYNLINNLSVYNNIMLTLNLAKGKLKDKKKKVYEVLNIVGLKGKEKNKVYTLSGGEQQRVAIARAIVNNPKVVLADEPTGALDSKTSLEIVNILKQLSNKCLVIMVTHNETLANTYSDTIIKLNDGLIKEIVTINHTDIKTNSEEKKKKAFMPFFVGLFLSYRNLLTKLFRTIATVFAGSIGIISVALVITVSDGVSKYIQSIQFETLRSNPIVITNRNTSKIETNNKLKVEYPDSNEILVSRTTTTYEHVSTMNNEFVSYVGNLNEDNYSNINYNRSIRMNLYNRTELGFEKVSLSYFTEMGKYETMNNDYSVLSGIMPSNNLEVALLVDKYNSISENALRSIGLDSKNDSYTFDEIIGHTYYMLTTDLCYKFDSVKGYYIKDINSEKLINDSLEVKIVGIIRAKEDAVYDYISSGIVYPKELTDFVIDKSINSEIVKLQLEKGLSYNVLTGKEFEQSTGSYTYTPQYQYEDQLLTFCAIANVNRIEIYTETFDDRVFIESYIKDSIEYKSLSNPSYTDSISSIAKDFATFIEVLTRVLIIFALISLLVSSIMIGIISCISVMERTKEIGIMRSIGARKIDIITIFSSESFIIGICSGLLGILLAWMIRSPINIFIQDLIKENIRGASSVVNEDLIKFNPMILLCLLGGNILLTIVAGLIPAISASLKRPIEILRR